MGKIILVTGGARSGKSTFAEKLAGSTGDKVLYIATSIPFDDEMKDRVKRHRERRPANWSTFEGYKNLKQVFHLKDQSFEVILLDCVTIMITNLLFELAGFHDSAQGEFNIDELRDEAIESIEKEILKEVKEFIDEAKLKLKDETKSENEEKSKDVILVTNEVGFGIVPDNKLGRIFRDIAGRINQYIASRAEEVYLVVCGLPLKIK